MTTRELLARAQHPVPASVDRIVRARSTEREKTVRASGHTDEDWTAFVQPRLALDAMAGVDALAWLMGELYPGAGWRS